MTPTEQLQLLRDALEEVDGCFNAAIIEGLENAIEETADEHLKDLLVRRLMYAHRAAIEALAAPPSQAPEPAKCANCGSTTAESCNSVGCQYLESGNGEPAQQEAAGATDWRELCRRLYVELFHCDQQMMSATDEEGEPLWTQGSSVRDVLRDAKQALESPASLPSPAPQAAVPSDVIRAAEFTREDLGVTGTNYPHIRTMLGYIESLSGARTAPVVAEDPLDWPLPCDVQIGQGTIKKGCKLRTLVARASTLQDMVHDHALQALADQAQELDMGYGSPSAAQGEGT